MLPNSLHTSYIGWSSFAAYQVSSDGWAFDPLSFITGVAVTLLIVGLIYRYRAQIAQFWSRLKESAKQLQRRLTASMADRYSTSIIEMARTRHLFAALASFEDIYVETRLYAPLAPSQDSFESLSVSPSQVIETANRLVLIGRPGCGRTTLLNHILLMQANKLQNAGDRERVPVFVYLPMLAADLKDSADVDIVDDKAATPAQLLVKTALSSMSRVVAAGAARWLRRQIETGNAIILLDGWDEVEAKDRSTVTRWIQELFNGYSGNYLVAAAGERGYGPLIEVGFVPLRPTPWKNRQFTELIHRWSAAWPAQEGDQRRSQPSITYTLTPPSPLEATIQVVIQLRGLTPASTPVGKMTQVLELLLPAPEMDENGYVAWSPKTADRALGKLAVAALEQGRMTLEREEIQSAVSGSMPPPLYDFDEEGVAEIPGKQSRAAREEEEQRTLQIVDCCRALTALSAPIRSWDNQRYYFAHPLITAFLAARYLAAEGTSLEDFAVDPAWLDVLPFYVGLAPAEPIVKRLMDIPDDIFLNHLWTASSLLAASPLDDEPWRAGLMARLGQLFLNPRMPTPLREPCLISLANSREAGVAILFRQAASGPDGAVRAGAILGLGALEQEQDLALIDAALGDPELQVRLAAVTALDILARTGNKKAMELIIGAMIEAEDQVQRVAVEALAQLGPEGHAVLRDAAKDEDLIVRRAAVYGLAAINEPWATETIQTLQREDDEWLVRNAAVQALNSLGQGDSEDRPHIEATLPQAESESWLISWAAERGEGTGVGDAALTTLIRALNEGDPTIRLLALDTLRRLGNPRTIDALQQTLRDPDPLIRREGLVALDEISRRHDLTINVN